MLHQRFSADFLTRNLTPAAEWQPVPRITNRDSWNSLPPTIQKSFLQKAEKAAQQEWPSLPASLYLEFARNGNRRHFETPYFLRRSLLLNLVLGECVENKGRFLDPIIDGIWRICEETSWCLPAHVGAQRAGVGLPDSNEPIIALFAAETAAQFAWIDYLLQDVLDAVSPQLRLRIHNEIDRRILVPFLERDDFWWMGFAGNRVNNWNPWILSNILTCALVGEQDSARRVEIVAKAMRALDHFIDPYPEDGGCDEGPGYWDRAGGALFDALDLLYSASNGTIDVFNQPKICEIGRFIYRVHIGDDWFVNFADAPARLLPDAMLIFRYGSRIQDEEMRRFGAWCAQKSQIMKQMPAHSAGRILFALDRLNELTTTAAQPPLPATVWLPDIQVMAVRSTAGTTAGFTLIAKGGHNQESHNHNDVGSFILFADAQPVLIDIGVETYCRKTFSPERYEIWTMQSQYHNLPTINGVMQAPGIDFCARDVQYSSTPKEDTFQLDIAGAYPETAQLEYWRRAFCLQRDGKVRVTETFCLSAKVSELFLSFLTPCAVRIEGTTVHFSSRALPRNQSSGAAVLQFTNAVAECETVSVADPQLQNVWGNQLYRVRLFPEITAAGRYSLSYSFLPVPAQK